MKQNFLCVAHRSSAGWEALCLDLDIAVTGRSIDEAKALMNEAIQTYIEDALREEEPHRTRLLNRRAPLWLRMMWRARIALHTIRGRNRDNDSTVGFPVPCHA